MSVMEKKRGSTGAYANVLNSPDCRSGYEYAQRCNFWHNNSTEDLQHVAEVYHDLYNLDGNKHAFGMAVYLRQLIESRLRLK